MDTTILALTDAPCESAKAGAYLIISIIKPGRLIQCTNNPIMVYTCIYCMGGGKEGGDQA